MTVQTIPVTSTEELSKYIDDAMAKNGAQCNLNHLDVSRIECFDGLFAHSAFNGDISGWDVSGAKSMALMFQASPFNGDLSRWNVARVEDMSHMFHNAAFNQDLSQWNPVKLYKAQGMFDGSAFSGDVSNWCPPDMTITTRMFATPAFHGNLSKWMLRTYCQNNNMVLGTFDGVLPSVQFSNHHSDYTVMVGGIVPLTAHLRRTPFSRTHADLLVWNDALCEEWATPEMLMWARGQIAIGLALGMDQERTRNLLVSTHDIQAAMMLDIPSNAFDFPGQ